MAVAMNGYRVSDYKNKVLELPLSKILVDPVNRVPSNDKAFKAFVKSLDEQGQLVPAIAIPFLVDGATYYGRDALERGGSKLRWWLSDGTRRWKAAKLLSWKTMKIVPNLDAVSPLDIYKIMLTANSKRLAMNPVAMARCLMHFINEAMKEKGVTEGAAIRMCEQYSGMSLAFIKGRLEILNSPKALQDLIESGNAKANTPIELKRIPSAYRSMAMDKAIRGEQVNVLDARVITKQIEAIDKREDLSKAEKHRYAKTVIERGGRLPYETEDEPDFEACLLAVQLFFTQLQKFNTKGFSLRQYQGVASVLDDIVKFWRNQERVGLGVRTPDGLKRMIGKS